jgi:hypothetical protein
VRAFAGYLAVVAIVAVGLQTWQHGQNAKLHRAQVAACARGNVLKAYLLLRAREFKRTDRGQPSSTTHLAPELFPLLDCRAEPPRPMARASQAKYLRDLPALVDH